MAGICSTCKYFKADAHPGDEKMHHCEFQNSALSEHDSHHNCPECIPKGSS